MFFISNIHELYLNLLVLIKTMLYAIIMPCVVSIKYFFMKISYLIKICRLFNSKTVWISFYTLIYQKEVTFWWYFSSISYHTFSYILVSSLSYKYPLSFNFHLIILLSNYFISSFLLSREYGSFFNSFCTIIYIIPENISLSFFGNI